MAIYLLAPLVTWFTWRMEVRTTVALRDTNERVYSEAGEYIAATTRDLTALGFEPNFLADLPQALDNVRATVKRFSQSGNDDAAMIEVFEIQVLGEWKLHMMCVEFCADFIDDSEISTGNMSVLPCWPLADGKIMSLFPKEKNITRLYQAHQAICRHLAPNRTRIDHFISTHHRNATTYLQDGIRREHIPPLNAGYLYSVDDEVSFSSASVPLPGIESDQTAALHNPYAAPQHSSLPSKFRPTLKGAYLMTWRLLWPVSRLSLWYHSYCSRQRLRLARAAGSSHE